MGEINRKQLAEKLRQNGFSEKEIATHMDRYKKLEEKWAAKEEMRKKEAQKQLEKIRREIRTFSQEREDRRNAMTHFFIIWYVSVVCLLLILIILSAK